MKDKECLFYVQEYGGWGVSVTLIRHNLSIIPLARHNFEHNTLVSRVTSERTLILEHKPTDPNFR